jgi:hypothetical protein
LLVVLFSPSRRDRTTQQAKEKRRNKPEPEKVFFERKTTLALS